MSVDSAPRTLIGVGVGPGEPELITVKAVRALEAADAILVPTTEASGDDAGRAEQIVVASCTGVEAKLHRIRFSMSQRRGVGTKRRKAWALAADAAVEAFEAGARTVAFATVGDPSVYSTFSYLAGEVRELVPGVRVALIPGITAMQALAATSLTPLVEGREVLSLVPVTAGLDAVEAALDHCQTVVAYKGGRQLTELLAVIREHGRTGVMGINVGLPGEQLIPLDQVTADEAPYFSTVLVTPQRDSIGGML